MTNNRQHVEAFIRLLDIMDELRAKCPWDREQTFDSLRTLTTEESYELSQAIVEMNFTEIKKELGDLLLHIIFYAKMGDEQSRFNISDVMNSLCDKLVYRHPHVFGQVELEGSDEVIKNWEELKIKEKDGNKSVLSGVPAALPALIKATRIQKKAAAVGFDWEAREQVWEKFDEERREVQAEIDRMSQTGLEDEFGDLFFSLVNAARLYGVDPETALEHTNRKFIERFNYLESMTIKRGRPLKGMSLAEMNEIWDEAKRVLKQAE